jgi:hypothetical protein
MDCAPGLGSGGRWRIFRRIPAALIGRLARDERVRGEGIGDLLLADAVRRVLGAARARRLRHRGRREGRKGRIVLPRFRLRAVSKPTAAAVHARIRRRGSTGAGVNAWPDVFCSSFPANPWENGEMGCGVVRPNARRVGLRLGSCPQRATRQFIVNRLFFTMDQTIRTSFNLQIPWYFGAEHNRRSAGQISAKQS